eukprot:COSAG06_NODE_2613_length_6581_cov_8.338476_2_plen_103_part_00
MYLHVNVLAVIQAALVCEKFGMEDKAQYYLTAAKDPDFNKGGGIYKVMPVSTSLIHSIQGRIYASQGKTDDAAAGTPSPSCCWLPPSTNDTLCTLCTLLARA